MLFVSLKIFENPFKIWSPLFPQGAASGCWFWTPVCLIFFGGGPHILRCDAWKHLASQSRTKTSTFRSLRDSFAITGGPNHNAWDARHRHHTFIIPSSSAMVQHRSRSQCWPNTVSSSILTPLGSMEWKEVSKMLSRPRVREQREANSARNNVYQCSSSRPRKRLELDCLLSRIKRRLMRRKAVASKAVSRGPKSCLWTRCRRGTFQTRPKLTARYGTSSHKQRPNFLGTSPSTRTTPTHGRPANIFYQKLLETSTWGPRGDSQICLQKAFSAVEGGELTKLAVDEAGRLLAKEAT